MNKITFRVKPTKRQVRQYFRCGQLYMKEDNQTTVYICGSDGSGSGALRMINLQSGGVWSSDDCSREYEGWEGFHPYNEPFTINEKD